MSTSSAVYTIVAGILLIAFICVGVFTKYDMTKWEKTTGEVVGITYGKSGGREFNYIANGTLYEHVLASKGLGKICNGEKFEILFDPKNPRKIYVLYYRPLFLESESTSTTTGTLIGKPRYGNDHGVEVIYIEYEYYVSGNKYNKLQKLEMPKNNQLLMKGMQFKVRYWDVNPQRSIIDLNDRL